MSIGEKLGAWGKFAGWGDKLKANAEVSAMSFGVLTLSTAFNAAFLANNIIEMQESLFSRKSGKKRLVKNLPSKNVFFKNFKNGIFSLEKLKINLTED